VSLDEQPAASVLVDEAMNGPAIAAAPASVRTFPP